MPVNTLTSRDRVLTALDHREPDRIPIFAPNIIDTYEHYDPALERFLATFPFDGFTSIGEFNHPPSELRTPKPASMASDADRRETLLVDGYGCRYRYKGVGLPYCEHHPLADAETVADVESFSWPDPEAPQLIAPDAAQRARRAHADSDRVTVVGVPHLFHQYHYIRGFEQWMLDVKLNRAVHNAIATHIHHINTTLILRLLDEVAPYVEMVTAADDFGTSTAPYMSPADWRALVKPYYADLIQRIKRRHPHVRFYLHSHGQIMDLVPDLIECGVDVLNPILPLDNMDPVRLKRDFGADLCFHGGIDIEHIVPFGTVTEVEDHVKRIIDILAPGGGYWLKLQAISPVCPPENVIAAYELAATYGRYPSGSRVTP
ncbi:MAG: uroporphyrinogen decarboxylase family protein [Anaerolineae bacterium]